MERFFMGIDLKKHVYEQSWKEKKQKELRAELKIGEIGAMRLH